MRSLLWRDLIARVSFFGKTIGTMPAATLATMPALQEIFGGKDHKGTIPVEVDAFGKLRRIVHRRPTF